MPPDHLGAPIRSHSTGLHVPKTGSSIPNMGTKRPPETVRPPAPGVAEALFSKVRQRVLAVLFGNPGRSYFANEIIALVGSGTGAVQRELARLEAAGLVGVTHIGRRKHYQANAGSPVFEELRGLVQKTAGGQESAVTRDNRDTLMIGHTLAVSRAALRKLARRYHIRRLVLFGSAARGELRPDSDIDLLVEFETGEAPSLGGMVEIQDAFARLFGGRKVDVATPSILNNPYRRRAIEKDMEVLYAA